MATPTSRFRGALVLASVLVGVAIAVGSHLLWTGGDSAGEAPVAGPDAGLERATPPAHTPQNRPSDEPSAPPAPPTSSPVDPAPPPTSTPAEPTSSSADPTPPSSATDSAGPTPTTSTTSSAPSTTESPGESPTGDTSSPTSTTTTEADEPPTDELLRYVNEERRLAGCRPADVDPALDEAADAHSSDMAEHGRLSHRSSDGTSFDDRVENHGYDDPAAENLSMGVTSARAVVDNWMSQPAQNANITDCDVAAMGAGLDEDGWYWTLDLGY